MLALLGETIDEGDEICGCRVVDKSARKGETDHLFLRECSFLVSHRIIFLAQMVILNF